MLDELLGGLIRGVLRVGLGLLEWLGRLLPNRKVNPRPRRRGRRRLGRRDWVGAIRRVATNRSKR